MTVVTLVVFVLALVALVPLESLWRIWYHPFYGVLEVVARCWCLIEMVDGVGFCAFI